MVLRVVVQLFCNLELGSIKIEKPINSCAGFRVWFWDCLCLYSSENT